MMFTSSEILWRISVLILSVAAILQFIAAYVGMRLTTLTVRRRAWSLASMALALLGIQYLVDIFGLFSPEGKSSPTLTIALLGLATAVFMLTAVLEFVLLIRKLRRAEVRIRKTKEALRARQTYLHAVLNNAAEAIIAFDDKGVIEMLNKRAQSTFGYRVKELIGQRIERILPFLADRFGTDNSNSDLRRVEKFDDLSENEFEAVRRDGSVFALHIKLSQVKVDRKHIYICIAEDMTERRRTNTALRESQFRYVRELESKHDIIQNLAEGLQARSSEEFFRLMVECLAKAIKVDAAFIAEIDDGERSLTTISHYRLGEQLDPLTYEIRGTPCETVVGKEFRSYADHVQDTFPTDHYLKEIGARSYCGMPLFDSAGNSIGLIGVVSATPINADDELYASILQIFASRASAELERFHVVRELAASEGWYRGIFDKLSEGLIVLDPEGQLIDVNITAAEMHGYTREEFLKLKPRDFIPPETWQHFVSFKDRLSRGLPFYVQCKEKHRDGSLFDIEVRGIGLEIGGRKTLVALLSNISERTKIERELKHAKFSLDNASIGIFWVRKNGSLQYVNKAACEVLGYTHDDLLAQSVFVIDPNMTAQNWPRIWERLRSEKAITLESTHLTADGRSIPIEVFANYFEYDGEEFSLAFVSDISDRQRLLEESSRAQKLESVGILAGGIAHDFNNLMTGVLGNVSLARECQGISPEVEEYLRSAEEALNRATGLTQQLLTFAKGGEPVKQVTSISSLLVDVPQFVLRGSNVLPVFEIDAGLPQVEVDSGQISQVLQNLVLNAQQAMPGGGKLFISAKLSESQEKECVIISIRDQGCGIPTENLEKIFDPYFTTKATGNGLGLSTSYSIIKRHKGEISVESTIGEGAMFTIRLPVSRNTVQQVQAPSTLPRPTTRSGRILVMDDEDYLRTLSQKMIESLGFEVDCVADGVDALIAYQRSQKVGKPYDVVILDLTVPGGLGGKETISRLLELDPHVRAIVCSGYSVDPVMAEYARFGFLACVPKPYRKQGLLDAINTALHASTRPQHERTARLDDSGQLRLNN